MLDTDLRGWLWTRHGLLPIAWEVMLIGTSSILLLATQSYLGASGLSTFAFARAHTRITALTFCHLMF
jgi:hypothetical protein